MCVNIRRRRVCKYLSTKIWVLWWENKVFQFAKWTQKRLINNQLTQVTTRLNYLIVSWSVFYRCSKFRILQLHFKETLDWMIILSVCRLRRRVQWIAPGASVFRPLPMPSWAMIWPSSGSCRSRSRRSCRNISKIIAARIGSCSLVLANRASQQLARVFFDSFFFFDFQTDSNS